MLEWVFAVTLLLSQGTADGKPHPVMVTLRADSAQQCDSLRTEAVKMLGGTKVDAGELEKTVGRCQRQ